MEVFSYSVLRRTFSVDSDKISPALSTLNSTREQSKQIVIVHPVSAETLKMKQQKER